MRFLAVGGVWLVMEKLSGLELVIHYQRGVVGEAGVPGGCTVHDGRNGRGRQFRGGQVVVDAPAGVVVECLAALGPPGVGPVNVAGKVAVDVMPADLLAEEAVEV